MFRSLKMIELNHILFAGEAYGPPTGLLALIVSETVAATLEELRLSGCGMTWGSGPTMTWQAVFVSFRQQLGRLRRFEVGEMLTYWYSDILRRHVIIGNDPERYELDRLELNELWRSLGQVERVDTSENEGIGFVKNWAEHCRRLNNLLV